MAGMFAPPTNDNPSLDPGKITLGTNGSGPYLNPSQPAPDAGSTSSPQGVLGSEAVRATGSGPFDARYRQNLTSFAGGLFGRDGGSLNFNPTGPMFGNPVGGGNAPLLGMPNSLLDMAFGGQPYNWMSPQPQNQDMPPLGGGWLQPVTHPGDYATVKE